ncbi:DUF397 domain-containing protein [Streptomyces sp. OfavH-34-F]|uniref:DUF397 domain-containing protein n=1 Tax=Streptomyces sp. OfavH-34-F TaxID=2917760 RepID=UPI001EF352AD|nr:DUF397 domain-containing protein [Streptomyces sp. OfavH-34-F]MCG7523841.1 DUF397 domain-containing protein [Streptomyces sp. OfavH-34-F]
MTNTNDRLSVPENPQWFKSSYSEGSGNACVEVALHPHAVRIRDSKDVSLPHLHLSASSWSAFLNHTTH